MGGWDSLQSHFNSNLTVAFRLPRGFGNLNVKVANLLT